MCLYVYLCALSMVRTIIAYIRTYRTSLSVYNMFHLMITLTASHAASMINTTDNTMCCNYGRYYGCYVVDPICINHMIFRGYNANKIHSVAFYGVFTPSNACLYTPTHFKRHITQINQFSYISTDFSYVYIYI